MVAKSDRVVFPISVTYPGLLQHCRQNISTDDRTYRRSDNACRVYSVGHDAAENILESYDPDALSDFQMKVHIWGTH